jgi:hypothetical protein
MLSLLQATEGDESDDEFGTEPAEGPYLEQRLDAVAELLRKSKESSTDINTVKHCSSSKQELRKSLITEL